MTLNRRQFVMSMAASGVGLALGTHAHAAKVPSQALPDDEFWLQVRRLFSLDKDVVYCNTGTQGAMPQGSVDTLQQCITGLSRQPSQSLIDDGRWPYQAQLGQRLAGQFGCKPDELAFTRSTTDSISSILNGLNLKQGDEILTTHHEFSSVNSILRVLTERLGISVKMVKLPITPGHPGEIVKLFKEAVTEQTRLMVFSHVLYTTGARLPVERICQEVAIPAKVPTFVDGAQALGMLALNWSDMGCDFYAASGQKWQCGPLGTGLLYIREQLQPTRTYWPDRRPVLWPVNSALYSYGAQHSLVEQLSYTGSDNLPAKLALAESCDLWETIGRSKIEDRLIKLADILRDELNSTFDGKVTVFSPGHDELKSALLAFNPLEDTTNLAALTSILTQLEAKGIKLRITSIKSPVRGQRLQYALRASCHLFNTPEEMKKLVAELKSI